MCYEKKVVNGIASEGQGLGSSEEEELRVYDAGINANNVSRGVVQVHDGPLIQQQQPPGPVIRWERFLPRRSLKVLLVENDDSTRQVVSALLRNCSYEVTVAANGLQAWQILEDHTNQCHIDLLLTEVVMPALSGIGLLCKIMSHKTLRTIPVIMMSSHDSMGLVFKCFSKGAADFLVKPIRKNELKNLWQHVWRRCHSSSGSGSGSESGTNITKHATVKCNEESENNTGSCDEYDDENNDRSMPDGSDVGSGTQSSWTKKAIDLDSPQMLSPSYQLADAPDSTCAQVIHTKPGTSTSRRLHATKTKESQEQDDTTMGHGSEIGVSKNLDLQFEHHCENLFSPQTSKRPNNLHEVDDKPLDSEDENNTESQTRKLKDQATHVSQIKRSDVPKTESRDFDTPNGISGVLQGKAKACNGPAEIPSLELTLTRLRGVGNDKSVPNDDRNALRHSNMSAFLKYSNAASSNQGPIGIVGSCSPLDNDSIAMKSERMHSLPSHSTGLLNQQSNRSSNNNDLASNAKTDNPTPEGFIDKPISAFKSFNSSAFQPLPNKSSSQSHFPEKADDVEIKTVQAQGKGSKKQVQVQHHHNYHHHHHHHYYHQYVPGTQHQQQSQADHDGILLKNMAEDAPQCGSSNMFEGPAEGNVVNESANGSGSGSNHGSNGQNGSDTALNIELMNVESDNGASGSSRVDVVSRKINGSVADEDLITLREAALIKFRQKRKERCFEKRVRYHSRKKLAEQRPRVRGQFVRRSDSRSGNECPGSGIASEVKSEDQLR